MLRTKEVRGISKKKKKKKKKGKKKKRYVPRLLNCGGQGY